MFNSLKSFLAIKLFILLWLFTIFTDISIAQKERITKIIDSNLFELADGRLIKLANIDVPNINHKNLELQEVGIDAYKYAKRVFTKRSFEFTYPKNSIPDTAFSLVYIIIEYPLATRDYSIEYLERGFGKYRANTDNNNNNDKFSLAENEAKEDRKGVWNRTNNSVNDTFDQVFVGAEVLTEDAADTIAIYPFTQSFLVTASPHERIILEIIGAPLIGIPSTILGGLVGGGIGVMSTDGGMDALGYILIGGYIGYSIGSSTGVYIVAKNGENKIDYGETVMAGLFGAVSGIALMSAMNNDFWSDEYYLAPLIMPGLISILYVNLIAEENPQEPNYYKNNINISNHHFNHNDLYNSTKLFEINLLKINF